MDRAVLTEAIGWISSLLLLLTIGWQMRRQWLARSTEAVSIWLFAGQFIASLGFTAYSALLGNTVFILTNAILSVTAVAGWVMLWIHRRREAGGRGAKKTG